MHKKELIKKIPKAELHLHIEGTFEPELMFAIARRNNLKIKYESVEDIRKAYNFTNLQSFLDIYYAGAGVLLKEDDFYDMTFAYLSKAHEQNIVHAEIFFDPQTHTERGISFGTVITGIHRALEDGNKYYGISSSLIMSFLRHLDELSAIKTLNEAMPFRKWISGVGLDSSEVGHPPSKFARVFEMAKEADFLTVAHAGEEGPPEYIWEALKMLNVSRIDHGNRSLDDEKLVEKLIELQMPLTLCPLSNLKLKVVNDMKNHPLKKMLDRGMLVTVNSDDPSYFGGYLNENYEAVADALDLNDNDIFKIAENSFKASFMKSYEKESMLKKVREFFIS